MKDIKLKSHPASFMIYYFTSLIILILFPFFGSANIFLSILIIAIVELIRRGQNYYLGVEHITQEFKMIVHSRVSTPYNKIDQVEVSQSNFEKIFKIGTIEINTNDSPSLEISLKGIKNPMTIARAIKDRASKEGLMIYRNSAGKKKNEWLTKATRKG